MLMFTGGSGGEVADCRAVGEHGTAGGPGERCDRKG